MELVSINSSWSRTCNTSGIHRQWRSATEFLNHHMGPALPGKQNFHLGGKIDGWRKYPGRMYYGLSSFWKTSSTKRLHGQGANLKAFAKVKRDRGAPKSRTPQTNNNPSSECNELANTSTVEGDFVYNNHAEPFVDNLDAKISIPNSSRSVVLQACIVTSGLILALGVVIRQVSHIAFTEGWPVIDASKEVSFDLDLFHLELITGVVILVSSFRYLLLKMWPDFAESSEAANQQVLGSLQPLDYVVVAFLPGISEEILFRGALLPLFGLSWYSALAVGAIFGGLHLGGGRRYSFAVWATFVGFAYGLSTIISSSIIVPMASHSLNNLVGGILWRYSSTSQKKNN